MRRMMGKQEQDPAAVARGKQVFVANCAFCHGSSATGGEGGPDLVRSILVLHDEKGSNIGPVVLNGRPGKGMPKFTLTQDQIADIAAFLHSQADAKANRMDYKIQNVVTGDPKAGQAYFAGHCAGCHSVTGDLAGITKKYQPEALQSRFLYPKERRFPGMPETGAKPVPTKVTVMLPSGESISGTLEHMDDFNVAMYDSQGVYHSWLRSRNPGLQVQVADPLEGHVQLLQQYTNSDMHNILAYLETLK